MYIEDFAQWLTALANHRLSKVWAVCVGTFCYLVEPSAAFIALWIAVFLDLLSRLLAEAVKAGGFFVAIRTGRIQSQKAFTRTAVKIVGYFILAVVAHQSKHVVRIEQISILFSTIIYSFLFLVESISIVENLVDAGLDVLNPLLLRFKRERDKLEHPGGYAPASNTPTDIPPGRWQDGH